MKPYEYRTDMNERLLAIRESLDMTQAEIGKAIGISGSRYGNLERNNGVFIKEHIVISLCKVFSVNYDYLVHGKGAMFNKPDARMRALEQLYSQLTEPYQEYLLGVIDGLMELQRKSHPERKN